MGKILGIDIGYGDVKVVVGEKSSDTKIEKIFKFSSAVAAAQKVSSIRDPRILEVLLPQNSTQTAQPGQLEQIAAVYVGDDALNLPSTAIIDIKDYNLLEAFAPVFIVKALELAQLDTADIETVVCGLSVAQLNMSGYFKERLKSFTVNGKTYNFENVFLLPQGAGSKLAFDLFGQDFPNKRTDTTLQTYVGCDIGFKTLDLFYVTNGKTSPNLFEGIENAGVMRVAQIIKDNVKETYNRDITLREAKEILDTKTYKLRGQSFDMSEVVKETTKTYSKEILDLVEQKYGQIIDKCDFISLLGGGASLLEIHDPFFKVVKSHSEFYNAIGYYLYGLKQ